MTRDHKAMELFTEAYDSINENYVKEVDKIKLAREAVRGMLNGLDPYSAYFTPDELKHFQDVTQGSYEGLGIRIIIQNGWLTVESPFLHGPAIKAGVIAGDQIRKINGESTKGITLQEAIKKLKGPRGSKVTITVRHRESGKEEDIVVVRDRVDVPSTAGIRRDEKGVWDYWLDEKQRIAYIRLVAFQENTAAEFKKVILALADEGIKGLILDLRFNPGGLLGAAVDICDLFIPKGVIVSTRSRNFGGDEYKAKAAGTLDYFPLVVLANGMSASASEIVAGAVQDLKRGVLVGSRTYGKGSVQRLIMLNRTKQGAVKLTVAAYYTPSGKSLYTPKGAVFENGKHVASGIIPDYEIKLSTKEQKLLRLNWAMEERNGVLSTKPVVRRKNAFVDKQLKKARQVLQVEMEKALIPASRPTEP